MSKPRTIALLVLAACGLWVGTVACGSGSSEPQSASSETATAEQESGDPDEPLLGPWVEVGEKPAGWTPEVVFVEPSKDGVYRVTWDRGVWKPDKEMAETLGDDEVRDFGITALRIERTNDATYTTTKGDEYVFRVTGPDTMQVSFVNDGEQQVIEFERTDWATAGAVSGRDERDALLAEDGANSSAEEGSSALPNSSAEEGSSALPSYTVAQIDDDSFGATKRYVIHIVLPGESTEDQRLAVARRQIEALKDASPLNAAGVFFWKTAADIGKTAAYGSIDYAPGGDWSAADTVETGDYESMEYAVQF